MLAFSKGVSSIVEGQGYNQILYGVFFIVMHAYQFVMLSMRFSCCFYLK